MSLFLRDLYKLSMKKSGMTEETVLGNWVARYYSDIRQPHPQKYVLIYKISTQDMYNPLVHQSHAAVPRIEVFGTTKLFRLDQHSYQPQPLLQRTMELFEQEELLSNNQKSARDNFVETLKSQEFGPDPTASQLWSLMQSLDKFFFSGFLTGGQNPTASLEFGQDIFEENRTLGEDGRLILGKTEGGMEDSTFKIRMRVEAGDHSPKEGHIVRRDMMDVLEILVYEMAHAYFILFTCPCGWCLREMGARGHGPAWQELKEVMYTTIRKWDPSLWNFYVDDRDELDYVQGN